VGCHCLESLESHKQGGIQGRVIDADEIFSLAQLKDWLWAKYKMMGTSFSFSDWILSPVLCLQSLAY